MMNYSKKRKRQNGRQEKRSTYHIYFDERSRIYAGINSEISKLIEDGVLPALNYDLPTLKISGGGLQD